LTAIALASALRADLCQIYTDVDGVYTADPRLDPTAEKFDELTYDEAIARGLRIMDQTAFALCGENKLPMVVFGMAEEGNILRIVRGEKIGTLVSAG
jgi:uridylate kinase